MKRNKGFSLLEVLVALGVLAIGLGAITQTIGSSTSNVAHLRDKTFAHWVAMNHVSEYQINHAVKKQKPSLGNKEVTAEMGGHEWLVKESTLETFNTNVFRVNVDVRKDKNTKQVLSSVSLFVAKP